MMAAAFEDAEGSRWPTAPGGFGGGFRSVNPRRGTRWCARLPDAETRAAATDAARRSMVYARGRVKVYDGLRVLGGAEFCHERVSRDPTRRVGNLGRPSGFAESAQKRVRKRLAATHVIVFRGSE
jgi:hypothetical protein